LIASSPLQSAEFLVGRFGFDSPAEHLLLSVAALQTRDGDWQQFVTIWLSVVTIVRGAAEGPKNTNQGI